MCQGFRLKICIICFFLTFSFIKVNVFAASQVYADAEYETNLFSTPGKVYIVDSCLDLKGKEIKLADNCTIKFSRGGKLTNGIVVGKNTKLVGLKKACLGVTIKGNWILPTIKDSFFDYTLLTDNEVLDNIYALQSPTIRNKIVLAKPSYKIVLTDKRKRGLQLKNNAVLELRTTLYVVGNSLSNYTVLSAANDNRIIGGRIVGDVGQHTYAEGTTSEWGFGIALFNCSNVRIEKVHISKCTGDGIYIGGGTVSELQDYSKGSQNVYIKNVICDDNRRQGISITYADGVVLDNCIFSGTGKTELTSPGCGMDIEPNKGQSVRNVVVRKCKILNNNKVLDASIGGYRTEGDKCSVENILLENCEITGPLCICTGSVTLRNCSMSTLSIHLAKMPKDKVLLSNCSITGGSGIKIRSVGTTTDDSYLPVYSFKSCTISMDEVLTKAMFSTINHKGNEVASFNLENCNIQLPGGEQKYEMIQSNNKCSFRFVKCGFKNNGRTLDLGNRIFENCKLLK